MTEQENFSVSQSPDNPLGVDQEIVDFKNQLAAQGIQGLAFDLDETIVWTVRAWAAEMSERFGNPEGLTPEELIAKYPYLNGVPYWQTPEAFAWMEFAKEDNEFQTTLPLVEGADHYVSHINEVIPVAAYITVRPQSVIEGTRRWLDTLEFPQAAILARPNHIPHSEGPKWKARVIDYLHPEIIGIVDDNPSLHKHLPPDYQGTIFWYDSREPREEGSRIIPCPTWEDVHREITVFYPGAQTN